MGAIPNQGLNLTQTLRLIMERHGQAIKNDIITRIVHINGDIELMLTSAAKLPFTFLLLISADYFRPLAQQSQARKIHTRYAVNRILPIML